MDLGKAGLVFLLTLNSVWYVPMVEYSIVLSGYLFASMACIVIAFYLSRRFNWPRWTDKCFRRIMCSMCISKMYSVLFNTCYTILTAYYKLNYFPLDYPDNMHTITMKSIMKNRSSCQTSSDVTCVNNYINNLQTSDIKTTKQHLLARLSYKQPSFLLQDDIHTDTLHACVMLKFALDSLKLIRLWFGGIELQRTYTPAILMCMNVHVVSSTFSSHICVFREYVQRLLYTNIIKWSKE